MAADSGHSRFDDGLMLPGSLPPYFEDGSDADSAPMAQGLDEAMVPSGSEDMVDRIFRATGDPPARTTLVLQPPAPETIGWGSNDKTVAEVVYPFAYLAALVELRRQYEGLNPFGADGIAPLVSFVPPSMKQVAAGVEEAAMLNGGRIRINAVGGHVLHLVIAPGTTQPDVQWFDKWYGERAGELATAQADVFHADRLSREERANARTEPVSQQLLIDPETADAFLRDEHAGSSKATSDGFVLTEKPTYDDLSLKRLREVIRAAYENDGEYRADTHRYNLGVIENVALRLVAMQNVIAALLYPTGVLPADARTYTLAEAEQLLNTSGFKKSGTLQLIGGVTFNPRISLMPVTGKNSLDERFRMPGLTRDIVQAAIALAEENGYPIPLLRESVHPAQQTPKESAAEAGQVDIFRVSEEVEDAVLARLHQHTPTSLSYEAVKALFGGWLALAVGEQPDDAHLQALFAHIGCFDNGKPEMDAASIVMGLSSGRLNRKRALEWVKFMRGQILAWEHGIQTSQPAASAARQPVPSSAPHVAAQASPRRSDGSVRIQPQRRQSRAKKG